MDNKEKKSGVKGHIAAALITIAAYAVYDYVRLPAYNIQSADTWTSLCLVLVLFGVLELIFNSGLRLEPTDDPKKMFIGNKDGGVTIKTVNGKKSLGKFFVYAALAVAAAAVLCELASSEPFNAKRYAAIAGEIETRDFIEDTLPSETISDIALMDSETARIIGARALGSLNDLVSQFEIGGRYTQINLGGRPMKVSPLEYADFFRWWSNKSDGIPGYIAVDPVANTSKYVRVGEPIRYAESAYFSHDLRRRLRFGYRTAIFGNSYFEIDESGTPYYVTPVLRKRIFLFGGTDVKGAVILNACTGETEYYDVSSIPSWVDIVYDGDMLTMRYDWYGELSGGFWNSVFAKRDCKRVTDDYGYKMFDDDVWVFTGVTSVASDESNIGFVLMNSRTAEIRYYAIPGAEEYPVMRSAEGEVQNLGYTASFPSVINVGGQPTYIMVLKDKGSLVKQYALIHVERYNIVVTGETQQEAMAKYRQALAQNGVEWSSDGEPAEDHAWLTCKVKEVRFLVKDGATSAYIFTESSSGEEGGSQIAEGVVFRVPADFEEIVLIEPGDTVKLVPEQGAEEGFLPGSIYSVVSFQLAKG